MHYAVLVRCLHYVIRSVSVGVNENHCGGGGNNSNVQVLIGIPGRYSLVTCTTHKCGQVS